jgi:Flp pilus assembly protein TadG
VTPGAGTSRLAWRNGQTIIEFSVVVLMTVIMLLFVVEMGRMVLVYTTVANAARAGVRYAIVHGNSRTVGTGLTNASGPASNPAQVLTVVTDFATAGLITPTLLVINVTYPSGSNAPGQAVNITVVYPYNPLTTYFSKTVRLGSAAQGVIVF